MNKNDRKKYNLEDNLHEFLEAIIFLETVLDNFIKRYSIISEKNLLEIDFSNEQLTRLLKIKVYNKQNVKKIKKILQQNIEIIELIMKDKA